jgi:CRISPR system Cascade subunit CasC
VTNNQLAINVIKSLLKAATLSHPTGKQNSFAAHNPAHFIGIEIKNKKVPVNLSNAFIKPIEPSQKNSLIEEASEKLAEYAVRNREAFSLPIKETAVFLFEKKEAKKEGKEIKKRIGDTFTPNESNRFDTLDGIINWLETELGA